MAINSNVGSNQFLIVPNNVPLPAKSPRELRPDVQSHATALPYRKRSPVLTQKSRKRHTPSPSTAPKLPSDNGSKKRHVLHRTRDLCPSARLAKSGRASRVQGSKGPSLGHSRAVSIGSTGPRCYPGRRGPSRFGWVELAKRRSIGPSRTSPPSHAN